MRYWTLSAGPEDDSVIERWLQAVHLWPPVPERRFEPGAAIPPAPAPAVLLVGPAARPGLGPLPDRGPLTVILLAREGPETNQMDRARSRHARFLATLAHDVRAPLGLVSGALAEVNRQNRPPAEDAAAGDVFPRAVALAERGLRRLLRQSVRLDALAALETGSLVVHRRPLDLRDVVQVAVGDARGLESKSHVSVETLLPPAELPAESDAAILGQAVGELVYDAMRHARGRVRVELKPDGVGGAEISVGYDGEPIPDSRAGALFRRYRPGDDDVDASDGRQDLALARDLVACHGGEIATQIREEGVTFVLSLPAAALRGG